MRSSHTVDLSPDQVSGQGFSSPIRQMSGQHDHLQLISLMYENVSKMCLSSLGGVACDMGHIKSSEGHNAQKWKTI